MTGLNFLDTFECKSQIWVSTASDHLLAGYSLSLHVMLIGYKIGHVLLSHLLNYKLAGKVHMYFETHMKVVLSLCFWILSSGLQACTESTFAFWAISPPSCLIFCHPDIPTAQIPFLLCFLGKKQKTNK